MPTKEPAPDKEQQENTNQKGFNPSGPEHGHTDAVQVEHPAGSAEETNEEEDGLRSFKAKVLAKVNSTLYLEFDHNDGRYQGQLDTSSLDKPDQGIVSGETKTLKIKPDALTDMLLASTPV